MLPLRFPYCNSNRAWDWTCRAAYGPSRRRSNSGSTNATGDAPSFMISYELSDTKERPAKPGATSGRFMSVARAILLARAQWCGAVNQRIAMGGAAWHG